MAVCLSNCKSAMLSSLLGPWPKYQRPLSGASRDVSRHVGFLALRRKSAEFFEIPLLSRILSLHQMNNVWPVHYFDRRQLGEPWHNADECQTPNKRLLQEPLRQYGKRPIEPSRGMCHPVRRSSSITESGVARRIGGGENARVG